MDRRSFIGSAALGATGLALMGSRAFSAIPRKPNIIVILADDLGYGDLGCYGAKAIATPNLDRLASNGVRLTSCFSSAAVCSPARAGLLTGRYPIRTGVNGVFMPTHHPATPVLHAFQGLGAQKGMNVREITMAQMLKTSGYSTCCVGKWHLGDQKQFRPHRRGFDHYLGVLYSNDMKPLALHRNDDVIEEAPVDQNYLTRKYTEEAVGWIDRNKERPFFLYFAHTFPHEPLHASPKFRGKSKAGLYGDCVEELDWSVGEVMKTLERNGLSNDTFVFFTSDNGPWSEGSPGPFRGRKGETFDGGMRAPGIANYPGVIPAGTTSDEMMMGIDLFTTAAALAGAEIPKDRPIDGMDIMPMLKGEKSPHEALYFFKQTELQAVRSGNWKYVRKHFGYTTGTFFLPKGPMLFNLETDPYECYDVADRYPDKAKQMVKMMDDFENDLVIGVP